MGMGTLRTLLHMKGKVRYPEEDAPTSNHVDWWQLHTPRKHTYLVEYRPITRMTHWADDGGYQP